jgi:hypothetical protein
MSPYSRTRYSSISLLEELRILHSTFITWNNYVVVFSFLGDILISFGYFLLECDVLMSDGNLQMCWRDVSNFLAHYIAPYTSSFYLMLQNFKNISNLSILKLEAVSHIAYSLPFCICFRLFFIQIHYTNRHNDMWLIINYGYSSWILYLHSTENVRAPRYQLWHKIWQNQNRSSVVFILKMLEK